MKTYKLIIYFVIISFNFTANLFSQNSYGWERIYNSVYGISSFYNTSNNYTHKNFWIIRTSYDYVYKKYTYDSSNWYTACNTILNGFHWSINPGGNYAEGWNNVNVFSVSTLDTNFVLLNYDERIFFYGGPIRFYYTYNNGINNTIHPFFEGVLLSGLDTDPYNDSVCFAAANNIIYKSTDRAQTWNIADNISGFNGPVIVNRSNSNYVYAYRDSLFVSSNGGNDFNFSSAINFSQLVFDIDSSVYGRANNKIYKSTNYGYDWLQLDSLPNEILYLENDHNDPDVFYAGTVRGLYKSLNGGNTFFLFNNTFTPSKKVVGIVKDYDADFVFVVTEEAVYKCWNSTVIGIEEQSENISDNFILNQNYPNPFNPLTNISFDIPKESIVKIKIFDITGREIKVLVNELKQAGSHKVIFNGSVFSSGVYFYKLEAGDFRQVKSMVLVK